MAVRTLGLLLLLFLSAHHASAAASSYTQAALDDEITDLPGRLLVCACVRACVCTCPWRRATCVLEIVPPKKLGVGCCCSSCVSQIKGHSAHTHPWHATDIKGFVAA